MKNNDFSSTGDEDDFSSYDPDEDADPKMVDPDDSEVSDERRYWQERFEEDDYDARSRDRRVRKKGRHRDKESD